MNMYNKMMQDHTLEYIYKILKHSTVNPMSVNPYLHKHFPSINYLVIWHDPHYDGSVVEQVKQ